MLVAIIDYGSGNLRSAQKAFERAAHERALNCEIKLVTDPDDVKKADRIVLPGVGAYRDCRDGLEAIPGMRDVLEEQVIRSGKPFFGICVGMQLMATRGLEYGETDGLNWIEGEVDRITPDDASLKIPHMGWNTVEVTTPHALLTSADLGEYQHAYFVHSFHFKTKKEQDVIARCNYGGPVTAMVGRDNLVGTQFHPEKSQQFGLSLIGRFLQWRP